MESDSLWGILFPLGVAIVLHGVLEGAEAALLTAQKSRLQQWKDSGRRGATEALLMHDTMEPYLLTIQMLRTFISVCATVLAGAMVVAKIAPRMATLWPILEEHGLAQGLTLALMIGGLTYGFLLGGQLLPMTIAQQYPEHILCWLARFLIALTRLLKGGRALLTFSRNMVLWFLGQRRPTEAASIAAITEEAVTTMVREGAERGIFEEMEYKLVEGVFEFTETAAREVMVPRVRIEALEVNTPPPEVLRKMSEVDYSRLPVYRGDLDHIVGVLHFKDVMRALGEGDSWELQSLLHPPLFVPETVKISRLLHALQQQHQSLAVVIDEHGGVAGLVTITDLLEQLVGEISDAREPEEEDEIVQLPDGSLVIEGNIPLWELRERVSLPVEEAPDYQTLAGLMLARLGRIPKGGETIHEHGYTFTVVDMDGPRIARVKVEQREPPEAGRHPVSPPSEKGEQPIQEPTSEAGR